MRQFMQAIGITFFAWAFTAMGLPIDSRWKIALCGALFSASLPFYALAWTVRDPQ